MADEQNRPSRRELRRRWEAEQANQPLTRREIRRREEEEQARLQAVATGELPITAEPAQDGAAGDLDPPRPPHAEGEGLPSRRSLRAELAERLENPADDEQPAARGPRRRTIAPPSTAQGVRIVNHATGEIKTLRPEDYATGTVERQPVLPAQPADGEGDEDSPAAGAEESYEDVVEEPQSETEAAAEPSDPVGADAEQDAQGPEVTDEAPPARRKRMGVALIVLAVLVLAVLVYIAAQAARSGSDGALAAGIGSAIDTTDMLTGVSPLQGE